MPSASITVAGRSDGSRLVSKGDILFIVSIASSFYPPSLSPHPELPQLLRQIPRSEAGIHSDLSKPLTQGFRIDRAVVIENWPWNWYREAD